MKRITSRENAAYKELKLLAGSSQARRKAGRTVLDGVHLCQVYLAQVGVPAACVASESALDLPEVGALVQECTSRGAQVLVLGDALYDGLSQVENGVGILFVIDTPAQARAPALTRSAVLLDNLQDPGNVGSILRSAAAAGIKDVFCSRGTVFAWAPKVLRAGMGAHFLLNIVENTDLGELMRGASVPVLATSSHADATIFDADLSRPLAWIFGHEGQGVAPPLLELAQQRVSIPHAEQRVESLNVAACAAVCLFEQVRQQRQAGKRA